MIRITYTNDFITRAFIIQIAIDDEDIIALPLRVQQRIPSHFLSLSQQLKYLAMVAEELESHLPAEDNDMSLDAILAVDMPSDPEIQDEEEAEVEEEVVEEIVDDDEDDDMEDEDEDDSDEDDDDDEEEE